MHDLLRQDTLHPFAAALLPRAAVRPALRQSSAFLAGLLGGWAVLYGALIPFGLGLTLGFAEDCFAACAAGAVLGLLLHGFGALSLDSICLLCAIGAAVAARWLWPGRVPARPAGELRSPGAGSRLLCLRPHRRRGRPAAHLRGRCSAGGGAGLCPAAVPARNARRGDAARRGRCRCGPGRGRTGAGLPWRRVLRGTGSRPLLPGPGESRPCLLCRAGCGPLRGRCLPRPGGGRLSCASAAAALLAPGRRVEAFAAYAAAV